MVAIADYADLAITTSEYTGRDDVMHVFGRFTALAEMKLNRRIKVRDMIEEATLTTNAAGEATLPADYISMRLVVNEQGQELQPTSLDALQQLYANRGGNPCLYAIKGPTFSVRPVTAADFDIVYYEQIPSLETNSTNWLLTRAPDVYLYACAAEVSAWEGNPDKVAASNALLDSSLAQIIIDDDSSKFSNAVIRSGGPRP
jgi:hypothetical protein